MIVTAACEIPFFMKDDADKKAIGRRIRTLRKEILQMDSQEAFASRLGGVTRGAVGNWERGKGIKTANLQRIADEYDVSLDWLATGRGQPREGLLTTDLKTSAKLGMIPVKGAVKAGDWQSIDEWGEDEWTDYVPSSSDYPLEWQYAFIVDGESLNKIARHGDRLICVDLISSQIAVDDDDLVIVEQSGFGGQLVQRTAKRVRRTMRGFELWPESTHPDHQEPIEWRVDGDPDHNETRVIAKVIWILSKP